MRASIPTQDGTDHTVLYPTDHAMAEDWARRAGVDSYTTYPVIGCTTDCAAIYGRVTYRLQTTGPYAGRYVREEQ